ncbi:MAG TPA: hypothetical protein VNH41_05645 [Steroidobacteraceae bacterium]|nr:hypothetical protein [Steroidobacteraceae bacterium]
MATLDDLLSQGPRTQWGHGAISGLLADPTSPDTLGYTDPSIPAATGSVGPIAPNLPHRILGATGDLLSTVGDATRGWAASMRATADPKTQLFGHALDTLIGQPAQAGGEGFHDWSQGFAPIDFTGSVTNPLVNREQLMNVAQGAGLLAPFAAAVPGALRDASIDFVRGIPVSRIVNNGSGESAASVEAINRLAQEKEAGITRWSLDADGNATQLHGVDAVDAKAPPGGVTVMRYPDGTLEPIDRGGMKGALANGLANRAKSRAQFDTQPLSEEPPPRRRAARAPADLTMDDWHNSQDVDEAPSTAGIEVQEHQMPTDAPFPQYAREYPPVPEPVWKIDKKKINPETGEKGKPYQSRGDSPDTDDFMEKRDAIQKDIDAGNYDPYFKVENRYDAAPNAPEGNTLTANLAKTQKKRDEHVALVQTQDARDRLNAAYDAGVQSGGHDRWYLMGQLQDEYIDELGEEAGKAAFKRDFADGMASTTAGQSPTPNLLMAHYGNLLSHRGLPVPPSYEVPYPVSGQYMGNNLAGHSRMRARGGMSAVDNPKGYDFSRNLSGDPNPSTIDAQMSDIINPGKEAPPDLQYGVYEDLLRQEAAKRGLLPRDFQDVAWGGKKWMDTNGKYQGMPMIQHVNEAIERTSKLTGLSPREVVRQNLIRKKGPIFGLGGAAVGAGLLSGWHNDEGT